MLDFAIGVSILLLVVVGVLTFIHGSFTALDTGGEAGASDRIVADRAADYLVESAFSTSADRRLSANCVVAYFTGGTACGFGAGTDDAASDAGLSSRRSIHVEIRADVDQAKPNRRLLCWPSDDGAQFATEATGCAASSTKMEIGPSAESSGDYEEVLRSARLPVKGRNGYMEVYVVVRAW